MNHGSFYLHFKALEHSNSLKKEGWWCERSNLTDLLISLAPAQGVPYLLLVTPAVFLPASESQFPWSWGWGHYRGVSVLFIFHVVPRSRQDLVTGSHVLEQRCLMLGVWWRSKESSVNSMKAPDGKEQSSHVHCKGPCAGCKVEY